MGRPSTINFRKPAKLSRKTFIRKDTGKKFIDPAVLGLIKKNFQLNYFSEFRR